MSKTNLKVILLGNKTSGKTSIINQYINKEFSFEYTMTIGQDKQVKKIQVENTILTLNIWDTAGQERFADVNKIFMKNSDIIILVYDITNKESFESLNKWYAEIKNHIDINKAIIGVAANKSDLYVDEEVNLDTAKEYCSTINSLLIETSATNYDSINNLFYQLSLEYYNKFIKTIEHDENKQVNDNEESKSFNITEDTSNNKEENNQDKKNNNGNNKKTCC